MSGPDCFHLLVATYAALNVARLLLALSERRRLVEGAPPPRKPALNREITVLQPILGGDPALVECLTANLRHMGGARLVWLLDDDDAAGRAAAEQAVARVMAGDVASAPDVTFDVAPPPPLGVNPKAAKLARGTEQVATTFVAVLDDDTILSADTLARAAEAVQPGRLVTGLPLHAARSTFWSRLVTGFVNANSTPVYLAAARLGLSRTVNGMFTMMRTEDLRRLGGFAAIEREVTDDYALARLFRDGGGRVVQLDLPVTVVTTVADARHYLGLMRRWMVFARLFLMENRSPRLMVLVLLPGLMAFPVLLAGLPLGAEATAIALTALAAKALAVRWLRGGGPISDLPFDIAAEFLMAPHALAGLLGGDRIRWRKRQMVLDGKRISDG